MRHRLLVVLVLCVAALLAGPATAADVAPTGRWVSPPGGTRVILSLYVDGSYVLTSAKGDKVAAQAGKYTAKDGHLVLATEGAPSTDFAFTLGKGTLTLINPGDGAAKGISLSLDRGPVIGTWHSDKLDTTWVLGADGAMESTEGANTTQNTYEVLYEEPAATVGDLYVHKEGSPTLRFHFTIEDKGARLVLGGGADAKDPSLRFPLDRVGAAPDAPGTPPAPGAPPAGGGPKRPKFPAAPKLPGGGGTTPAQPTAPVAPTPGTAPAPAPDAPPPAPAADSGPTWDTAAMTAKGFKILKTNYDADGGKITWVLEATRDITAYPSIRANYYDADDIKIWDGSVSFSPSLVSKGEKVRGEMALPYHEKMKNVVKIVLVPG